MQVSTSAYYAWRKRPGQLISADILHLHRRMKALFKQSRDSLGNREMMKKLREEGFQIGRYKVLCWSVGIVHKSIGNILGFLRVANAP